MTDDGNKDRSRDRVEYVQSGRPKFFADPVNDQLLAMITALGAGFLLSALNVRYRDVRYMIPVFLQVLPLLSGVMYAVEEIPAAIHRAFEAMTTGRSRPAHVEIPPDTLAAPARPAVIREARVARADFVAYLVDRVGDQPGDAPRKGRR